MDNYEVSFTLILHAGNAKSAAMMAIEAAREGTFEEAQRLLEDAKRSFSKPINVKPIWCKRKPEEKKRNYLLY